jgi:uncharacterized repeat protein (TIGR01451 family)
VTNADSPDPVAVGGSITYVLTVTNAGPAAAPNVQVLDSRSASATLVSAKSSQGSCVGSQTVSCSLGHLANGAKATVTIVVKPTTGGVVINDAFVFGAGTLDPKGSNNAARATTTAASPSAPKPSPQPSPQPSPPPSSPGPALPSAASPPPPRGAAPTPPAPPVAGPQAARDVVPPGEVADVRASVGNRSVVVRWRSPSDPDLQRVVIRRSAARAAARVVYSGRGERFADRSVRNGVRYVYVLRSVDRTGNSSAGVRFTAIPKALPLFSPAPNARVSSAPLLHWGPVRGASYYNVQLYRGSRKVLSAWPLANQLRLRLRWNFGGRGQRLAPGVYHWFVWPGRGPRNRSSYGSVLGQSSFVVVPRGR